MLLNILCFIKKRMEIRGPGVRSQFGLWFEKKFDKNFAKTTYFSWHVIAEGPPATSSPGGQVKLQESPTSKPEQCVWPSLTSLKYGTSHARKLKIFYFEIFLNNVRSPQRSKRGTNDKIMINLV